jgi:hypothetical protein
MNDAPSPCPVCGFIVFSGPPGSYDICPVCGWEDDPVQLVHPLLQGGANRKSLAESQIAILKTIPVAVREQGGFKRDDCWRPLNEEELRVRSDVPNDGQSYFEASTEDPIYYWLSDEKK